MIVPEQFLVLFRPGTTSVRSGLGTFFVPEPEHGIRRTESWLKVGSSKERVRTVDELSCPRAWGRGYSSAAVQATHEAIPHCSAAIVVGLNREDVEWAKYRSNNVVL